MIVAEAGTTVAQPPAKVFALLDDLAKTPLWNTRCIEVKQTTARPRGIGTRLHYQYSEAGQEVAMEGKVVRYEPERALGMKFANAMVDVAIEFVLAPAANGTDLLHRVTSQPKSFVMKLMATVIRGATRK